jgi:hypothetical protein
MTAAQHLKPAWQIEAGTYPNMSFDEYRSSLIYETPQIRNFLTETRGEHFLISAPKGFGKTLLLIAKRKQIEQHRGYHIPPDSDEALTQGTSLGSTGGGEIVDRPRGPFPVLSRERIDQLKNDYFFWKTIWWISIMIASLKQNARISSNVLEAENLDCDRWIRDILLNTEGFNSPTIIFTTLIGADYSTQQRVIKSSRSLNVLFDAIRSPIAFFIDNVDEYFKPMLEEHHITSLEPKEAYYRAKSNDMWTVAQLALAGTAYELRKSNSHVKVYCTIRREALIRLDEYDAEYNQIIACTVEIDYERPDFREIFIKNIRAMKAEDLFGLTGDSDYLTHFFGPASKELKHRFVDQSESAFSFVLRHTFYRPRDLMILGRAIADISPRDRTPETIKRAIDRGTEDIVKGLMSEMRPFFYTPDLKTLFQGLKTNVITLEDIEAVTRLYKEKKGMEEGVEKEEEREYHHPFCVLYKIGMLGCIQTDWTNDMQTRQRFLKPREITVRNHVDLPVTEGYYLIHPALDRQVASCAGGHVYYKNFHRSNIIGNDAPWVEPATSLFVAIGDVFGFSRIMGTELYEPIATKLYEWAESACQDLDFFEIDGGDSIVMIDKSGERLVRSTAELLRRAAAYKEHSLTFRFGGAAGPIAFRTFRRRANESWQDVIFPTGLALRTSARIQPHAPVGALVVDDVFGKLFDQHSEEFNVKELDGGDIKSLTFSTDDGVFFVQKKEGDPVHETKLYRIELAPRSNDVSISAESV